MDSKLSTPFTLLLSVAMVLMLGALRVAMGAEAIASDAETSSAVFISDDDSASVATDAPPAANGSLVMVGDLPDSQPLPAQSAVMIASPPAAAQPLPKRDDVVVISNQSSKASLQALRPLVEQSPDLEQPTNVQPTIESRPGDIAIAVHDEPLPTQQQPSDSIAALLVGAHRLSLKAETQQHYSTIVEDCAAAIQLGAKADQRTFASELYSWALNRRGQLLADEGNNDLADADFQAALDFNSNNWRALHNRGVSYAQSGQFADAFDDFSRVIQLNPKYPKAYANRATLYVQARDLQAALKDYQLAIKSDAQFATAHVGLARVCHMMGRWEEALEHFAIAIRLEPTNAGYLCSRGDLHSDMGSYGEALADYASTIEIDPDFAHAYRNGAWLLATCPDERFRDPENAVVGARQALEAGYGDRHIALDTLAAALASNGQFEEAVATVTEAVDLAPEGTKYTYLARRQLYLEGEAFRTDPIGDVSQATYEAGDK